jgi:hypothetical protein
MRRVQSTHLISGAVRGTGAATFFDGISADLANFVLSILVNLRPKQVVSIVVVRVLCHGKTDASQKTCADHKSHDRPTIEHAGFSVLGDSHESRVTGIFLFGTI